MLIAAAVCPHPPLLLPKATGTAEHAELTRLRQACRAAVAAVAAASPDVIAVVGAAGRGADVRLSAEELPLSLVIGRDLIAAAAIGPGTGVIFQPVPADATPGDCLAIGKDLAATAPRVALLAMGDGPGRRARNAPGVPDPRADAYDREVTGALAAADPAALATLDPADDGELYSAGRPAWQVLAGALADSAEFTADVTYSAVPFEVSYYVAVLALRHT